MKKILFVCLGNICRSSLAEGILQAELAKRGRSDIFVDSAGTSDWHIGNPPDSRAIAVATQNGFNISGQQARHINPGDFEKFDLIVAMDADNLADIKTAAPIVNSEQLVLCRNFGSQANGADVPDPYYGGDEGFHQVVSILKDACNGIADHITLK